MKITEIEVHFHSDTETWKTDVVNEQLTPINGFLRVPESPGLGVTLNRDELERLKSLSRTYALPR